LGNGNAHNDVTAAANFVTSRNNGVFAGRELFYVWAIPTGVRVHRGAQWPGNAARTWFTSNPTEAAINFMMLSSGDVERLEKFSYNYSQAIGISRANRGANTRSWFLLPSLRVPLLIEDDTDAIDIGNNTVRARVSPYSENHPYGANNNLRLGGSLYGLEEVHLVQAACIFTDGNNLTQRVYDNIRDYTDYVLATNVLGVYFVYDDQRRILTMYSVARGNFRTEVRQADNREYLRSKLPASVYSLADSLIPNTSGLGYRILVESMTWRIIN
jgi:hypothetical protein